MKFENSVFWNNIKYYYKARKCSAVTSYYIYTYAKGNFLDLKITVLSGDSKVMEILTGITIDSLVKT